MSILKVSTEQRPNNFDLFIEDQAINISFRCSSKTNKIMIKDVFPNGFEVVYPNYCNISKAKEFFIKHYEWICFHAKKKPQTSSFEDQSIISLLGEEFIIEFTGVPRGIISIEKNKILIPGTQENSKTKIKNFLKNYLLYNIKEHIEIFTKQIGKKHSRIAVTDFKSKWGSCTIDATLAFNLKLVFAPMSVVIYVVAHEVAHLREMNHSSRFWETVKQLQPGFEVHRKWLKNNSHLLKRYIL